MAAIVGFYAVEAACKEVIRQNAETQKSTAQMQEFRERLNRLVYCQMSLLRNKPDGSPD